MLKLWSISTTLRNPERLKGFLKVLKLLEGLPFDTSNQIRYQVLLIQHRLYVPENKPVEYQKYFYDPELEMPFDVAQRIFDVQNYTDPAMRGRQSVNPLNKLGFSLVRANEGKVHITELGNRFISEQDDMGYVFFKSLLKLQFPNPLSDSFSKKNGFDIQPFIATMHLIKMVNGSSEKNGLSKTEFSIFVPSLINYRDICGYAENILRYRKSRDKNAFFLKFAKKVYDKEILTETEKKNFFEYGDNIMRYFRLTKYFKVVMDGIHGDWRIDLEPIRQTEVDLLLKIFSGKSFDFDSKSDYLDYISDIGLPKLPWEDPGNLLKVANALIEDIRQFSQNNNVALTDEELRILSAEIDISRVDKLNLLISNLRMLGVALRERVSKYALSKDSSYALSIVEILQDLKKVRKLPPEQFEKIIAQALLVLDDELKIKPNYPVDDNGEPISNAPGGKPDIECFYENYNAIYEVTLDSSNFQWVRETQPVMRHLRDFENTSDRKKNYCLFIAPKIHVDTFYHFWTSVKHGYNGATQLIVPFTTCQFAEILKTLLCLRSKNKRISHSELGELFDRIVKEASHVAGHSEWFSIIPDILEEWKGKQLSK